MTDRLYYTDSLLRVFDAVVVSVEPVAGRWHVVLDRTAFYPASGGQPFDTGRLADVSVVDVVDRDDGAIVHVVDGPLAPGAAVRGEISWLRRLDHMQQHTGQHLLSAAFDRLAGVRTVGFHLGADRSTIDLAREVTQAEIDRAELEANRVVWEDHPVVVRFESAEDARRLGLRKESGRDGELRLIEVPDFDLSACGGTHVPRTGVVGLIAVTGWERFKGATRLTFACGRRARDSHAALRDVVADATRALSVTAGELVGRIARLQADLTDLTRSARRLESDLAVYRAVELRAEAETMGGIRGVLRAEPGRDAAGLKTLAAAIVSEPGLIVVLTGAGQPVPVVAARSGGLPFDAGVWMRAAAAALGGKGGGRPELAQGGLSGSSDQILSFARETLLRVAGTT